MLFDTDLKRTVLNISSGNRNKSESKHMRLYQTEKVLYSEGNSSKKNQAVHWMREDIYKCYIQQYVNNQTIQIIYTIRLKR